MEFKPPYFAVVFTSKRTLVDSAGYAAMAERMEDLARRQPGFLGLDSARGDDGVGVTVSYWESEQAIRAWYNVAEHQEAQRLGKEKWYAWFQLHVCRVDRAYRFERPAG
ncbi:MAG: antibiotic biosynthesis monooxygenase [Gemmataceae bacterium]|nr:antibiotic biosynthesis monooxygenase [Gemmataceae bacterium]MCI0743107.1 antibiotic biosynthesis monooxygenase [Gemmataceae bacterium]